MIWYRRNSAVTSLVDTATTSASAAGNVAESVGSMAGSVVTNAGSMAGQMLQPVMDPLRRLQTTEVGDDGVVHDNDRLWVAVDGMGGDHSPGEILEGSLQAIDRLPLRIRFVGETNRVMEAAEASGLTEPLNNAIQAGHLELIPSGFLVHFH